MLEEITCKLSFTMVHGTHAVTTLKEINLFLPNLKDCADEEPKQKQMTMATNHRNKQNQAWTCVWLGNH